MSKEINLEARVVTAQLIKQARKENKMLCAVSFGDERYFTPDELEKENSKGQYIWGKSFSIVDKQRIINSLLADIEQHNNEIMLALLKIGKLK